ncbi:hypothetical protein PG999_004413 [Apiospora kogelbergensis]|uniref:Secreted protein n=1 Tax=Apiospora kogelbergensis TaxID=1337665 RepID=A0AAW0QZ99_9PEZI
MRCAAQTTWRAFPSLAPLSLFTVVDASFAHVHTLFLGPAIRMLICLFQPPIARLGHTVAFNEARARLAHYHIVHAGVNKCIGHARENFHGTSSCLIPRFLRQNLGLYSRPDLRNKKQLQTLHCRFANRTSTHPPDLVQSVHEPVAVRSADI